MGTIGGNIANGSPIGDMPPPLIALGAELTLRSRTGTRTIPLEDSFLDYGKQHRMAGEFVATIFVPLPAAGAPFAAYTLANPRDEDISALCGAFSLDLPAEGRLETPPTHFAA